MPTPPPLLPQSAGKHRPRAAAPAPRHPTGLAHPGLPKTLIRAGAGAQARGPGRCQTRARTALWRWLVTLVALLAPVLAAPVLASQGAERSHSAHSSHGSHSAHSADPGSSGAGPAQPGDGLSSPGAAPVADDRTMVTDWGQRSRAMERARLAVVGVAVQAVDGARSARTLGLQRRGSGVLISEDGLVLTIGYLLIEADTVDLSLPDGREVPARVRAIDAATGLGLLQALAPTGLAPVPLAAWVDPTGRHGADANAGAEARRSTQPGQHPSTAQAAQVGPAAAVTMVSGGPEGDLNTTQVLGQAPFAGAWEYRLDRALLTHPPLPQHSGAALFNGFGELVGIGSLLLNDVTALLAGAPASSASAGGRRVPGNLFVPADLLLPILPELQAQGRSQASARAWLGLQCGEDAQGLQVLRVNDDSPADVAGLLAGDRVLRLDGAPVRTLAGLWQQLWAGGAAERAVRLDILRDGQALALTVHSVDRDKTWRRPQGI